MVLLLIIVDEYINVNKNIRYVKLIERSNELFLPGAWELPTLKLGGGEVSRGPR